MERLEGTTRAEFLRSAAACGAGALGVAGAAGPFVGAAAGGSAPDDPFGALVVGPRVVRRGRREGPLAGRTFVAKDLFAIAGLPTGAGCRSGRRPTRFPVAVPRRYCASCEPAPT